MSSKLAVCLCSGVETSLKQHKCMFSKHTFAANPRGLGGSWTHSGCRQRAPRAVTSQEKSSHCQLWPQAISTLNRSCSLAGTIQNQHTIKSLRLSPAASQSNKTLSPRRNTPWFLLTLSWNTNSILENTVHGTPHSKERSKPCSTPLTSN